MHDISSIEISAVQRLKDIVGVKGWISDPSECRKHATDWIKRYYNDPLMVLTPSTTAEVSAITRTCNESGLKIVPQGGNTSLACGSIPTGKGNEVIVNLSRMNRIREIDAQNDTISVDAGCVLSSVQQAALDAGKLFPLRLGSEGSCQIGGNIASNAGGTNVLRYGNMRDLVLGLEVVLADGRILNRLRGLRKDNTGYDLKQLFIGSEGTLGIVTGAVLKLFPLPTSSAVAICAVPSIHVALELLGFCKERGAGNLTAFELMPGSGLQLVFKHFPTIRYPLDSVADWQVLIEYKSSYEEGVVQERFETILSEAFEAGLVIDAAIGKSYQQNKDLWLLREALAQADYLEGELISADVSVPISAVPDFIEKCSKEVLDIVPAGRVIPFGHLGDGNVHFGLLQPSDMKADDFLVHTAKVQAAIYSVVLSVGGSISAEHGLGYEKTHAFKQYSDSVEFDLVTNIKRMLDPRNTLNPGKVLA